MSPLSIYSGLTLALAGSDGRTHQEIFDTLFLERNCFYDIHHALTKIGCELKNIVEGDRSSTLVQANGLFLDSRFRVEPFFNQSIRRHFGVGTEIVSFSCDSEYARCRVNEWVARNTCGKICDLMPPGSIDVYTRLVLANAIYFKGMSIDHMIFISMAGK